MCKFTLEIKKIIRSKPLKTLLMFFALMVGYQTAYAIDDNTDYIEYVYPLKIILDAEKLEGFIAYKICRWDSVENRNVCKKQRLPITPQTKAYANNEPVPLAEAKGRIGKYASVVYYKDTLVVKAISW